MTAELACAAELTTLLVWVFYPLWLAAGAVDYVCHRRSGIAHTSGTAESWYHIAQFGLLLAALVMAVLLEVSVLVYGLMLVLVATHSVVAYLDVRYTQGRRFIAPLEQQVHGFMDVIPLAVVGILGARHWPSIAALGATPLLQWKRSIDWPAWAMLCSFALLSGGPVLEEWLRTRRAASTN